MKTPKGPAYLARLNVLVREEAQRLGLSERALKAVIDAARSPGDELDALQDAWLRTGRSLPGEPDYPEIGAKCLSPQAFRRLRKDPNADIDWGHLRECAACKGLVNALERKRSDPFVDCIPPEVIAARSRLTEDQLRHSNECSICSPLVAGAPAPADPEKVVVEVARLATRMGRAPTKPTEQRVSRSR